MLTIYLLALGFGGTLLVLSMVLGDHHGGADHGGHTDATDGGGGLWAAARSLRFWIFALAFGGAVGAVLTRLGAAGRVPVAVLAAAVGLAAGGVAMIVMRAVGGAASSTVDAAELAGATGVVTVAIAPGAVGKIRVEAKGRALDVLAASDDAAALPSGTEVLVIGGAADGTVQVTRASNL